MKKIISIFLSFSIVFLSVSTCIPISVCADTDKTVLSKSSDSPFAYSSSEAQKYVSAHLDIYDSDNTLLFSYTPTSTYNWTYSAKGKDNLHLSDNQLKAFLMSKKTLSAYAQLMFSGFSNNNVTRGFLSALGIATTGNSNALTDVSDKLLGNYNYLNSINYDEDTQIITMDNTSVDKLREEIQRYYYQSIGLVRVPVTNKNPATAIDMHKSYYEYEEDYMSDYNAVDETGEDITFSIKDMNENLGSKMDTLIDSINSGKGNMSADELQNAIDKGLEDLNKNTEDIKDNTSDILDTLKEQNNILLQILGVTEYIAYQNDKYNNTYTKADMSNLFKKSFNRVSDAVLYGEKVDDDNENTVDRSKFSYHNGIFGHFPFSVPYQLYEWLKVFQAEPECPEFTYHYGFLIGISKDNDEYDKYKITFNLSAYDSWRKVAASFLKLSFTLTMAIGTYKKFKGEL